MKFHPNYGLLADPSRFKLRYQASAEPQDIRIAFRVTAPQNTTIAQWRLDDGVLGGAEFAPWLTEWEPDWDRSLPPWKLASRSGERDVVYWARVTGMSHRFVPHLAARIALNTESVFGKLGVEPASLEIIGSLPITDRASAITQDDVMPMLWDVTSYPKAWSDLGFAVEHVASLQNEFGVQIEMARELDDKWSEEIKLRLLDMIPMFESFASQSGKPIDFAKTRRKRFPPLVKGLLAQGYCGEVLHDHEPCSALLLNMLEKFHRKHAPITRVRITSRVTARGKPSRTEKENWVTWQLPGDSLSGASNASPAEPTTKPQAIQAVKFSETTTYTPLRGAMEHGAENLDNDGLLAGDATDPALYAALVAEIYLEPVADADAEALQKAVEHLRAALGPQLRFSMTANNNAAAPRVFKYQPKHFENIAASLATLTGSRYGSKLLYLMLNDDHQKEVDVSFKGTTIGPAKPTASASPWTVSFRARINEDKPEGVFVAPARLAFSVPMSFGLAPFAALLAQIVDGDLRIRWATAGYGYACWDYFRGVGDTIDLYRRPTKSKVARQRHHASEHLGFDIGLSENCFDVLNDHIRSVNWLTILGAALWHRLPESNRTDIVKRFSPEQLGRCLLIRASEVPQVGEGKAPPDYAALDAMLLPIRLRTGLIDDEWADDASTACDRWLARFETLS